LGNVSRRETTAILSLATYFVLRSSLMYVDVWSQVARRQRVVNLIETLWKLRLIDKNPALMLHVSYYKVSNVIFKQLLKAKVRLTALLWRIRR